MLLGEFFRPAADEFQLHPVLADDVIGREDVLAQEPVAVRSKLAHGGLVVGVAFITGHRACDARGEEGVINQHIAARVHGPAQQADGVGRRADGGTQRQHQSNIEFFVLFHDLKQVGAAELAPVRQPPRRRILLSHFEKRREGIHAHAAETHLLCERQRDRAFAAAEVESARFHWQSQRPQQAQDDAARAAQVVQVGNEFREIRKQLGRALHRLRDLLCEFRFHGE